MFHWLEEELKQIKTPRFHRVDGPVNQRLKKAINASSLPVPESYKCFASQFGNADFFREGITDYRISIHASPRVTNSGELNIGTYSCGLVLIKGELADDEGESPVFEYYGRGGLQKAADSFPDWLTKRYETSRKKYGKRDWRQILSGPMPFSLEEKRVVQALRRITWKVVGIGQDGKLQFRVRNESDRILPYLSIGVKGKRRDGGFLEGGIWLPIESVKPGEQEIVAFDCYADFMDPSDVELLQYPLPKPEDRSFYWEFKGCSVEAANP